MMPANDKIEEAIMIAEAETGVLGGKNIIPLCLSLEIKTKHRLWTDDEEAFILENHGRLSEDEMAVKLGRSVTSVHIHREREMHLTSMSKDESILTAEQVANGLGIDSKSVHRLMDRGLMPCRRLPSARTIRVIDRIVLMKWMLDSENWLYFKPQRVGEFFRKGKRNYGECYDFSFWENARAVMVKAFSEWNDQWLTPGQVVAALKINPKATHRRKPSDKIPGVRYINLAIRKGNLKAKRWGNWWIRKSDLPWEGKTINYKGHVVVRRTL
jgi:hypothetical protein